MGVQEHVAGGCCMCEQRARMGASRWEEKACPDCPMTNIQPKVGLERLVDLSTISNGITHLEKWPLERRQSQKGEEW